MELPLAHCVVPGTHSLQTPFAQPFGHTVGAPHWPLALQVCSEVTFAQRVLPGAQARQLPLL
jgi:hypothetical protein